MALVRVAALCSPRAPRSARKSPLREGLRSAGRKDAVYPAVVLGGVAVPSSQTLFAIVGGWPYCTWHSSQY